MKVEQRRQVLICHRPGSFKKCFNNLAITHLPHKAGFAHVHTYNLAGRELDGENNPKQGQAENCQLLNFALQMKTYV